jgi:1-acyl-sn-glycerol-3-phosphate acyltransferase
MWKRMEPIALDPGTGNIGNLKQVITRLKQNQIVGLFPEGGLQRENRELQPFRPGTGVIAQRSGATIVPVWISGTPRVRFMLWHLLRPSHSVVIYGEPYTPDPDASREDVAADLRRRMLDLSRQSAFGDMECPQCEQDLSRAFRNGTNVCPECGWTVWDEEAADGEKQDEAKSEE